MTAKKGIPVPEKTKSIVAEYLGINPIAIEPCPGIQLYSVFTRTLNVMLDEFTYDTYRFVFESRRESVDSEQVLTIQSAERIAGPISIESDHESYYNLG